MKVIVLGRGKLGRALYAGLRAGGVSVTLQRGSAKPARPPLKAKTIYLLAVPDAAIESVAGKLAPELERGDVVLHCAGARDESVLRACAEAGAATGVMHPLVSFASRRALPELSGATFVAQGSKRALRAARALSRTLDARCVAVPIIGPAYHAAAALLANGSAALAFSAQRILVALGLSQRDAQRALAGLLASVALNVRTIGVPAALTGPVSRGDAATVAKHLRALRALAPDLARDYRRVLPIIERCAQAQRAQAQRQR